MHPSVPHPLIFPLLVIRDLRLLQSSCTVRDTSNTPQSSFLSELHAHTWQSLPPVSALRCRILAEYIPGAFGTDLMWCLVSAGSLSDIATGRIPEPR
jgi:hypothetical protein